MKRQYLKNGSSITLCGKSGEETFSRAFTIMAQISDGGYAVCYEAWNKDLGHGILKEFYPNDADGLSRDENGQLVTGSGNAYNLKNFLKKKKDYLRPYELLLNQDLGEKNLDVFIPFFEIYHGQNTEDEENRTAYIWTPRGQVETFQDICDEIRKNPETAPEYKLSLVLRSVLSLTKCICVMHELGLIHRDIKPSNFGFREQNGEILTQQPAFFDINSVCLVYDKHIAPVRSDGYTDPEAFQQSYRLHIKSDLYSIGATLFHAVVISDQTDENNGLYKPDYFYDLPRMLHDSRLIRASEANEDPRLQSILTRILQKCLCRQQARYSGTEELIEDLIHALYYLLPASVTGQDADDAKWELTSESLRRSLDRNPKKNSSLTMLYHLYGHPLYEHLNSDANKKQELRVLITGFGNYGQRFLDACLQAGQMRNTDLRVTVIPDYADDKDIYLAARPALKEFFCVKDFSAAADPGYSDPLPENSYGAITFCQETLPVKTIKNILVNAVPILEKVQPHYIFIALGNDRSNQLTAEAFSGIAKRQDFLCSISYACENRGNLPKAAECSSGFPLYVNEDITASPLFPEIDRMAFHTHLIWEKSLNPDRSIIQKEFRQRYNYNSCVSNVLSVKYKLHSVGIDLERNNLANSVRFFKNEILEKADLMNDLIWIEHRRWVTEKICQGWTCIENLEDCAGGKTKDTRRRRHVCIRRSRPDRMLADTDDRDYWDDPKEDLNQLDDLDRMSAELHRMYAAHAKEEGREQLIRSNLALIEGLIGDNAAAAAAFLHWRGCIDAISGGCRKEVHYYKGLRNNFLRSVSALSFDKKEAVLAQVKSLDALFYPVWAAMEYRDWKQDDVALTENIPFILTGDPAEQKP